MVDAYHDMFEELALVNAYTPDPCDCSDVMLHRPQTGRGAANFIGLSHRKEAKDVALAHGKTNGAMRILTSQTSTYRAQGRSRCTSASGIRGSILRNEKAG